MFLSVQYLFSKQEIASQLAHVFPPEVTEMQKVDRYNI